VLIAGLGWRSIFINLPIGTAGLWLTRRYAQETPTSDRRIDLPGQLAAIVALGALAWALIEGGASGYSSVTVVIALTVAAAGAAAFLRVEATGREPMLPLSLFRRGAFAGPAFLWLVVNVAFYGLVFVFSLLSSRRTVTPHWWPAWRSCRWRRRSWLAIW
jgi:DHA2 family methylenomycin A resistance protein-like MFS transporter